MQHWTEMGYDSSHWKETYIKENFFVFKVDFKTILNPDDSDWWFWNIVAINIPYRVFVW